MGACLGLAGFSKAASGNETGGEQAGMITREAKFLDVFAGRGVFFIYLSIRLMTLGKYYCLLAGLGLMFFGIANIIVHGFVVSDAKQTCKQLNYVTAAIGIIVMLAGGMGFYWGTKVI